MTDAPTTREPLYPLPADVLVDRSGGLRAIVSDHAVRRYAERVLGMRLDEDVTDQVAIARIRKAGFSIVQIRGRLAYAGGVHLNYGANGVVLPGGARVVVKDDTVVTVKPKRT